MALIDEKPNPTGASKLGPGEIDTLKAEIPSWSVTNDGMDKLEKDYSFKDFSGALDFANKVGEIAEQVGHHPYIGIGWGSATVRWWSHSLGGLSRNDFIMAAKTDQAAK